MSNPTLNATILDASPNSTFANCTSARHDGSLWGSNLIDFCIVTYFFGAGLLIGISLCASTYSVRWSEATRKEYYDILARQGMPGLIQTIFKTCFGFSRLKTEGWTEESQEAFNEVRAAYNRTVKEMKIFEKTREHGSKSIFDADCNPELPKASPV